MCLWPGWCPCKEVTDDMRTIHAIAAALFLVTATTVGVFAQESEDPQADLVPTELTHAPEDPIEGDNATFNATVSNEGEADADSSFNVTFLVDGEQVGENKTIDSLRFGDETNVTSDEWNATPGDHEVRVVVDPHEDISESDEENNELAESFDVAAAEVDFAVTELASEPEDPVEEDEVAFEAIVANEGNVASNNTTLRFFVDGDALGDDVEVPALAAGENVSLTSENWTAEEGEHTIRAFVDPARETNESDEENNDREEQITVESIEANLLVDEITLDPDTPEPGENVTFTANVTNDGHSEATNVTVDFLLDGEQISNATIERLDAGESQSLASEEWNASEGDHTIRVEVDTDENVNESDEDDNARERDFTVAEETEEEDDEEPEEGEEDADEEGEDAKADGEQKITICHIPPGNPDARHTKEIGEPAWEAHEGHGDHKGVCDEEAESHEDDEEGEDESGKDRGAKGKEDKGQDRQRDEESEGDSED